MKELLFKRKKRFFLYLIACFFPIIREFIEIGVFGLLAKAIYVGEMGFFIKAAIVAAIYVPLTFFLQFASRLMRIKYMRDTVFDVRKAAFDNILAASYREFAKRSKETYISNLINDVNIFERDYFINLLNIIYNGGLYAFALIIAFFIDWKMALVLLAISLFIVLISKSAEKRTARLQKELSEANEKMTLNVGNVFNGLEIIKLNNIESKFLESAERVIDDVERRKCHFRFFTESQRNLTYVPGIIASIGLMLYLIFRSEGGSDYSLIMVSVLLANKILYSLPNIFPRLNVLKASVDIYKKITTPLAAGAVREKDLPFRFEKEIRVENLRFSYGEKQVLKDVSFVIEKGKKYLIKGASGVGKSTLVKLLAMTYDDYLGRITADGVEYRAINEKSFNDAIAFVYQEVFLFEDTLGNNIALYKPLPEETLKKAIDGAGLRPLIAARPEGVETAVAENGKNLSGGERQRISIARAIAKSAEIIFVDEGTSALDEKLGREIEKTFLSLPATVISVSHRYYKGVSELYDYVLEIKNGKIRVYSGKDYFASEVSYV